MTQMLAEGLFRVDGDRAVLLGSRRRASGVVKFPAERPELFDSTEDIEPVELSTEGTLFTFTTQEFPPPLPYKGKRAPDQFRPYVVGYIELPEGLLVEALIVGADAGDLQLGQPMVSTTTVFETADGNSFLTYAFTPAKSA
ncbi:DNA-binding protein [Mycobacterium heckeshornense]|uniref:Zn-ribbon domain-containing OB-fold protein n=1 Tax=Mycobacterium heckeshornense TaxID=110505 RepID=UPI001945194E|nr:OB-fold domain-containing protein [Mycobacterium heckeshornense]BCQ07255.1 DNA-binding protein [Mycobacterium heckeshornense]